MPRTLRVLIVEDNPADAELVLRELRRASYDPQWERVDSEADYVARLEPGLDVILSDYTMPNFSGRRALTLMQERGLDLPFIIISGTIGEDLAVEVMRQGAADYLLKDRLARLGPAVAMAVEKYRLRKENEKAVEALRQSEYKYRQLFESLNEAAFLIECSSRRILDANLRAEELLGRPRAEILGMDEVKLFGSGKDGSAAGRLTDPVQTPRGQWLKFDIVRKDRETITVRASVTSLNLSGRPCVLALMGDLTSHAYLGEGIQMVMADEAGWLPGGLLSSMTQQIRSPMSGLVGVLDELLNEIPSTRREVVETGRNAAMSLLKLLEDSEESLRAGAGPAISQSFVERDHTA
jgi:PAS domain S-box-containing protein